MEERLNRAARRRQAREDGRRSGKDWKRRPSQLNGYVTVDAASGRVFAHAPDREPTTPHGARDVLTTLSEGGFGLLAREVARRECGACGARHECTKKGDPHAFWDDAASALVRVASEGMDDGDFHEVGAADARGVWLANLRGDYGDVAFDDIIDLGSGFAGVCFNMLGRLGYEIRMDSDQVLLASPSSATKARRS